MLIIAARVPVDDRTPASAIRVTIEDDYFDATRETCWRYAVVTEEGTTLGAYFDPSEARAHAEAHARGESYVPGQGVLFHE